MARASTKTDIANLALASLGEKRIANIDDTTDKIAVRCSTLLSEIIEDVQLEIQWQSLYVTITPSAVTDNYLGFSLYQYPLPSNFLDIVQVSKTFPAVDPDSSTAIEDEDWYLEDNYLITPVESAVIKYKKYSEEPSDWSPRMKKVIWRKLAMELAMPITEDPNIEARAERKYLATFHEALTLEENRKQYERKKRIRFAMLRTRMRSGRSIN